MNRLDRTRGPWRRRAQAAAAVLVLCSPLMARADETSSAPKKTVAEKLLEIMRAKNVIDEEQYRTLLEQAREEAAERS
ncbi:MAG: hypothetical protein IT386_17175, partial [Deltaproteobacteria bacterium]|nr:hypothetical protein [Deltaproteobacteria bacterium]